ncbi:MAG TPA: hypothetical protein VF173_12400 [Thermoanaerobaculia bacterium]|nr:hypothetical protein [Thermoanaerobaculia bacterium]
MMKTQKTATYQQPSTGSHPEYNLNHNPDSRCGTWDLPGVDPKPSDAPCDCCNPPPSKQSEPCQKPPRSKGKDQDCCQQILNILRQMPGGRDISVKKPKQSPKVKIANLCCKLPIKDAIVPILLLFLRRFLNPVPPANDFEKGIQAFLASLPAEKLDALKIGLDAYDKLPPSIRECAFETRFDTCDNESLLDPQFIFKVWLNEAIHIGRASTFDKKDGELRIGGVRPWDRVTPAPPDDKSGDKIETAPWPWICQVNPGGDGRNWYKNTEVTTPGKLPLNIFRFEDHEFSKVCVQIPDPGDASKFKFDCHNEHPIAPPPPPPGGFGTFANSCQNNRRYDFPDPSGTVCLTVPKTFPGQGIALRGLNFISPNCKARLRRVGGGFQDLILDCGVIGDTETPLMRDGKVVVSCEVRDIIMFTIPEKVRIGVNDVPVPPGRYALEVVVPNDTNYAPKPGPAPTEFVSNDVWLDVLPSPNQEYRFWTDEAFCIEETDGLGSDEPWFQAYSVRFVPSGTSLVTMLPQQQTTILRTDDVDSGESIAFSAPDLFHGKFAIGEVFALSVYGLEVDSDDAAEQQIKDFGEAYLLYWENFFTGLAVGTDVTLVSGAIARGAATGATLVAGAAFLVLVAVVGLFYAGWAPADPIGFDVMTFDSLSLFDLTNPTTPLPAAFSKSFDELSLEVNPQNPKKVQPGATQALYSEDHIYRSDDEDSTYKLVYRVERV